MPGNRFLIRLSMFLMFSVGLITPLAAHAQKVVVVPMVDSQLPAIRPSAVVEITASLINDNSISDLVRISPQAANTGSYTVPSGKMLVITLMQIRPLSVSNGTNLISLVQNNAIRDSWRVPNSEISQFSFTPGILIDEGYTIRGRNGSGGAGNVIIYVQGYEVRK